MDSGSLSSQGVDDVVGEVINSFLASPLRAGLPGDDRRGAPQGKRRSPRNLRFESLERREVLSGAGVSLDVSAMWFQTVHNAARPDESVAPAASGGQGDASIGEDAGSDAYDWIVKFRTQAVSGITSVAHTASLFHSGVDVEVLRGLGKAGQVLVRTRHADLLTVQEWLGANSAIELFERDSVVVLQQTPNDPSYSSLSGMHNTGQSGGTNDADIDAPEAWDITTGSSSVVVGIIDTGMDYNHPDLVNNVWTNPGEIAGNGLDDDGNGFVDDIHGYDFRNDDGDPMDDHSHGTHIAGTIGASGNNGQGVVGVNWNVKMMALKFLGSSNTGMTSDAVRAINYATMMKYYYNVNIRVLSNSWGSTSSNSSLQTAITECNTIGILFVAAAGNDGANNDTTPTYPASNNVANVIAVAATDKFDALASYSNYGATSVDLAAPGSTVYSTMPGGTYGYKSGTSMAAPHVAGAAALAWAYNPNLTVAEVKAAILGSVDVISSLSGKTVTGGRLNLHKMLLSLQSASPPSNFVYNGATLTVQGASGVDTFEFVHGNGGQHTVIYNGQSYSVDAVQVTTVRFEGNSGSDSAIVRGSNGGDTAVLNVGGGTVGGSGWSVVLASIETIDVYGGAGDSATLNDSSGNDTLVGYYNQVTLSGSGYSNKVRSFASVYVVATTGTDIATLYDASGNDTVVAQHDLAYIYGTGYLNHTRAFDSVTINGQNGGVDTAYMYGSTGNDTFTGRATLATFAGTGFSNTVNGFDNIYANAIQGGTDVANLYDSSGNDTFIFTTQHAYIVAGVGQFNLAENFDSVYGYAQNGGVDTAQLFSSAGNDTFRAYEAYCEMSGAGFYGQANGWDKVYGRGEMGGNDTAYLYDTPSNDSLVAKSDYAYVSWGAYLNFAQDFETVYAVSSNGGADIAYYFDSAGNDTFTGRPDYVLMTGIGFYNHATGYKNVYVRGTLGGIDTATLNDSTGDDTFVASTTSVYLRNATFHHEVSGFDNVYAVADKGGVDNAYLFDTAGNDTFVGRKDYSYLSGSGLMHRATGFDYVFSQSSNGGVDSATFYDSSGNDNFTAGSGYAYMTGTGFTNNTTGFTTVRAECTAGGYDQSFVNDSPGNDSLVASGSTATLTKSDGTITSIGFDRVRASGASGGTNTSTESSIDFVLEKVGTWN